LELGLLVAVPKEATAHITPRGEERRVGCASSACCC